METKKCNGCWETKASSEFSKDKSSKDGLQQKCKSCNAAYRAANKEAILLKNKNYYQANKEAIAVKTKAYRIENKDAITQRKRAYVAANKEAEAARKRAWYEANKELAIERTRKWYLENKEYADARNKQYRERTKEMKAAYDKEFDRNNKAYRSALKAANRAKRRYRVVAWDTEFTEFVCEEAYHLAELREEVTGFKWHLDHVIPLCGEKVSGLHVWNNFAVIPASENLSKNNSYTVE